jgi:hypothetical protein
VARRLIWDNQIKEFEGIGTITLLINIKF